jgi:broad specificity phosphatase PhoE
MTDRSTHFWLVRHAETATPHLLHGAESDVGLSERGERQATAAAEWFRVHSPTVVVSSAMHRAVRTAAPIAAACGVSHQVEPAFHERRVGALSKTPFSTTDGPWPETLRRWQAGETSFTTPGAESFDDLRTRLVPAVHRLVTTHAGGRVVLVAHGVVCKVLLLSLVPGLTAADWGRLGKVLNLSVAELTHSPAGDWSGTGLLTLPAPVAAISGGPAGSSA